MPEGPEVEIVKRGLLAIKNQQISQIIVSNHPKYNLIQDRLSHISRVLDIHRIGKFLIWEFDSNVFAINHLGMTGIWSIQNTKEESNLQELVLKKHFKLGFHCDSGDFFMFEDIRTFGRFEIYNDDPRKFHPTLVNMGPDILDKNFSNVEFSKRLKGKGSRGRSAEIGNALLNQSIIAGCGNIYKSESLFLSNIDPRRKVNTLSDTEMNKLGESLQIVAKKALEAGGSTIRDFVTVDGYDGLMQNEFKIYGKENEPCPNCQSTIIKIKQGGRSTYLCAKCQK